MDRLDESRLAALLEVDGKVEFQERSEDDLSVEMDPQPLKQVIQIWKAASDSRPGCC